MRARHGLLLAVPVVVSGIIPLARAQTSSPPVREITKIAGEVYRFRNAGHYSVFAVTRAASSPPTPSTPMRPAGSGGRSPGGSTSRCTI